MTAYITPHTAHREWAFQFRRKAQHGTAKHSSEMQGIAKQHGKRLLKRLFFEVFSLQQQRIAMHRKAAQCIAKQIGLAIGNSGLPDVFSHHAHSKQAQRTAVHRTARQGTA